jgi:hypothetical protein
LWSINIGFKGNFGVFEMDEYLTKIGPSFTNFTVFKNEVIHTKKYDSHNLSRILEGKSK